MRLPPPVVSELARGDFKAVKSFRLQIYADNTNQIKVGIKVPLN